MFSIVPGSHLKEVVLYKAACPKVLLKKNLLFFVGIQSHFEGFNHCLHTSILSNKHFAFIPQLKKWAFCLNDRKCNKPQLEGYFFKL